MFEHRMKRYIQGRYTCEEASVSSRRGVGGMVAECERIGKGPQARETETRSEVDEVETESEARRPACGVEPCEN